MYVYVAKIPQEEVDWSWVMRYFSGENNNACVFSCCTGDFFQTTAISSFKVPSARGVHTAAQGSWVLHKSVFHHSGSPLPAGGMSSFITGRNYTYCINTEHAGLAHPFVRQTCGVYGNELQLRVPGTTTNLFSANTSFVCLSVLKGQRAHLAEGLAFVFERSASWECQENRFHQSVLTQRNGDLGRSLEAARGGFVGQKKSAFIPQYHCTGNTLDPTPASPLTPNEIETSDCPIRVHPYSNAVSGHIIFPKVLCSLLAGWPWANCSLKLTRAW